MSEYALRLQNGEDTAARVRMADLLGLTPAGAVTARTGIRPAPTAGDVAVSAGTMNVTVQPFVAWVQGGVSAAQGGYVFVLDAAKALGLANGHATLSRTDVVAVVIEDDAYDGSGDYSGTVTVVQGTPGAGVPALPTNCLPLRNVTVPAGLSAGTGGLASGNLSTDRRTYTSGLGGVVTVASSTERDALPATNGTLVYRKDTDRLEVRRAGAWETIATSTNPDTTWTTPTLGSGWTVGGDGTAYRRHNGSVTIALHALKGSWPGSDVIFTLPAGFRPGVVIGFQASGLPIRVLTDGQVVAAVAGTAGVNGSVTFPAES